MRAEVADPSEREPLDSRETVAPAAGWALPVWTIAAAALTFVAIVFPAGPGAQALAIAGVVLVPGSVTAAGIGLTLRGATQRAFVAVAIGCALLLGIGLVCAVALRPLGVAHPLTRGPMAVVWALVLIASVVASARGRHDPLRWLLAPIGPARGWWLVGLGVLPALALLGAGRLNAGRGGALAVTVSTACVVVLLAALGSALWKRPVVPGGPAIFMSVVALVAQVTSRGTWLFGTDVQHEYFVANHAAVTGQFSLTSHQDPYQAMLSLTVLPAQLHALSTASVEILLQLLPALVLAFVAIGVLCIFRALVPEGPAVAFTLLFVGVNTAFLSELPSITRQCYGLMMFEAMIFLIVAAPTPIRRTRVLAAALGITMAVSHYSTAFIAVPVLALGWVFGRRFSAPSDPASRPERSVLSAAVVGVSAVATALWGLVIAGSGTQLSQLRAAIRDNGLAFFPSTGGVLTRWINASTKTSVSAQVLQRLDAEQTARIRPWLKIDPRALQVHLADATAPKRAAVPIAHGVSSTLLALANQLLLVASVLAVIAATIWLVRGRHRVRADLVGMALGAIVIGAVARISGTVAQNFGPERVQVQLGVLLLAPLAILVASATRPSRRVVRFGLVALVVIELAGATGLSVIAFGGVPGAQLSASGENAERFTVNSPDLYSAQWTIDHTPQQRIVQTDPFGKLALANFTGAARANSVDSVDPVATDRGAWIYATPANIARGRARGSVNGKQGVFVFPTEFYDRTRPILFATDNTRVYGPAS